LVKAVLTGGPRDGQVVRYVKAVLIPIDPESLDVFDGSRQLEEAERPRWQVHGVYRTGNRGHRDQDREGRVRLYWQGYQRLGNK
jgi:hypothetical protein